MVHYVSATALTAQAALGEHGDSFGLLLKKAGGMGDIRDCPVSLFYRYKFCFQAGILQYRFTFGCSTTVVYGEISKPLYIVNKNRRV